MYLGRNVSKNIGGFIQDLRTEKGITQEALAEGLCAVSTLSRIENGSLEPRAVLFQNLMERLGEPGFFRGFFIEPDDLDEMTLKRTILESYEYDDMSGFEKGIHKFYEIHERENVRSVQFLEYMKLLYWEKSNIDEEFFLNKALEVLGYTRKNFHLGSDMTDFRPDGMEALILNGIMVYLKGDKHSDSFWNIFRLLYFSLDDMKHILPSYWKVKAGLLNNLAAHANEKQDFETGRRYTGKAMSIAGKEGGLYFFLKLLRTRIESNYLSGMHESVKRDIMFLKEAYRLTGKSIKNRKSLTEFLMQKKGIMVF